MVFHAVEHVIGNMNISVSPRPQTDIRFILTVKIGPARHKKPGLRGNLQKRGCLFRCVIAVISLDRIQTGCAELGHERRDIAMDAHWVRERGDLSLEDAVRAVTSTVARAYRIKDRGRLVPGAWADLLLFDPKTVARGSRRRVNDLPTGASRLDTPAVGLHGVWVNGVRAVDERGPVRDCGRPGRVLRDFAA